MRHSRFPRWILSTTWIERCPVFPDWGALEE
jgi:hypothetical protein